MRRLFSLVFLLLIIGGGAWVFLNRQPIIDYAVASQYKPSSAVIKLEDQIQFTPKGDALFRAVQPEVDNSDNFNQHCQKKDADSIVLGCYIDPQNIFVYNVTDSQLSAVMPVTAAHETLHAAYARLSSTERAKVNSMVEAALPQVEQTDPNLAARLAIYQKTEPGQRDNELHSILGTEAQTLPQDLETYYSQYFKNRHAIAAFAASYDSVFSGLQANQATIEADLNALNTQIDTLTATYNSNLQQLNSDIGDFNAKAQTPGGFSSEAEFDSAKASLTTRRNQLDSDRQIINSDIDQYNTDRSQLQALNVQVDDLNAKLDSTASPSF